MTFKVQITDESGWVNNFVLTLSSSMEEKNLNDFILEALQISENKRKLPLKIQYQNGIEVYPRLKMKFQNNGSPLLGDELEAMVIV